MKTRIKKILLAVIKYICVILFWVGVWALLSKKVGFEFFLPSPKNTVITLFELSKTKDFWVIMGSSLLRVLEGIVVSLIIGTLFAILTEGSKILNALLSPLLTVIKSTPVASFIILALLWMERAMIPAFIISLIVIPIVWSNIAAGIRSVDKDLKEVSRIYSFPVYKKIFKLYIPSVFPFFMAACKASLGMAWKAGISAEILSLPQNAIGTQLYYSKTYFETESLFAWTLSIIILSTLFEKLFVYIIEKAADGSRFIIKGGSQDAEA